MTAEWATVLVGVLSFVGTLMGAYFSNKRSQALIAYRIEQLERKVDAHNHLVERTYMLEEAEAVQNEQIKVINHRIEDLEKSEQSRGNDGK